MQKKDGTVWVMGLSDYGEFGNNTASSSAIITPYKMLRTENIMQISSGESHIAMLAADGTIWGAGRNSEGQLGLVDTSNRVMPQQMLNTEGTDKLRGIKQVSCGMYNTVLVTDKGDTLWSRIQLLWRTSNRKHNRHK